MKKKLKRLDKKNIGSMEQNAEEHNIPWVAPKKDWKVILVESIAYVLIAIVVVVGLVALVKNPKEFFGEKEVWFEDNSWPESRYIAMVCVGIFAALAIAVETILQKLKKCKDKMKEKWSKR